MTLTLLRQLSCLTAKLDRFSFEAKKNVLFYFTQKQNLNESKKVNKPG